MGREVIRLRWDSADASNLSEMIPGNRGGMCSRVRVLTANEVVHLGVLFLDSGGGARHIDLAGDEELDLVQHVVRPLVQRCQPGLLLLQHLGALLLGGLQALLDRAGIHPRRHVVLGHPRLHQRIPFGVGDFRVI